MPVETPMINELSKNEVTNLLADIRVVIGHELDAFVRVEVVWKLFLKTNCLQIPAICYLSDIIDAVFDSNNSVDLKSAKFRGNPAKVLQVSPLAQLALTHITDGLLPLRESYTFAIQKLNSKDEPIYDYISSTSTVKSFMATQNIEAPLKIHFVPIRDVHQTQKARYEHSFFRESTLVNCAKETLSSNTIESVNDYLRRYSTATKLFRSAAFARLEIALRPIFTISDSVTASMVILF